MFIFGEPQLEDLILLFNLIPERLGTVTVTRNTLTKLTCEPNAGNFSAIPKISLSNVIRRFVCVGRETSHSDTFFLEHLPRANVCRAGMFYPSVDYFNFERRLERPIQNGTPDCQNLRNGKNADKIER